MLQETILRLAGLSKSITIVTGAPHRERVCQQIREFRAGGLDINVVVEPDGRDSMPAIGLAAALLRKKYGDEAVVGSFAADHIITDPHNFQRAVEDAQGAARQGFLTTIGVAPWEPSSAFGYIQPSDVEVSPGCQLVAQFVEKPSVEVAEEYVNQGFLWNAGMFVFQVGPLLGDLQRLHPTMAEGLDIIAASWGDLDGCVDAGLPDEAREAWAGLPRIAIDHALAEPLAAEGKVAVAKAQMDWNDVGDFTGLPATRTALPPLLIDSDGSIVLVQRGVKKQVVVIGVPDAVVVDTEDALLVTTRAFAQRVKEAPARLKELGRGDLT